MSSPDADGETVEIKPAERFPELLPARDPLVLSGADYQASFNRILEELKVASPTSGHIAGEIDDVTLGLADAVATVCDVLGFYQERIANEAFLSTAVEKQSVLELAKLTGYLPQQGISARAYLAYTIAPTLEQQVRIKAGSRIAALPLPGEPSQIFETTRDFDARSEHNILRVEVLQTQQVSDKTTELDLVGADLGSTVGSLVVVSPYVEPLVAERDYFFIAREVTTVRPPDGKSHTTLKVKSAGVPWPPESPSNPDAQKVDAATPPEPLQNEQEKQKKQKKPRQHDALVFRRRANVFGHNAPPKQVKDQQPIKWTVEEGPTATTPNSVDLEGHFPTLLPKDRICIEIRDRSRYGEDLELYTITKSELMSRTDYGITGNITRLWLDRDWKAAASDNDKETFDEVVQRPTIHIDAVETKTTLQTASALPEAGTWIRLSRPAPYLLASHRVIVSSDPDANGVADPDRPPEVRVIATQQRPLSNADQSPVGTEICFDQELPYPYDPATMRIHANVVEVTHGETYEEVLGSGDSSRVHQSFPLSRGPIAHLQASLGVAALPQVAVRVGDEVWTPTETLAADRLGSPAMVVSQGYDGKTRVIFGDGQHGARLPTGRENIAARYRIGGGASGNLAAERIKLPIDHPLGVQQVINLTPSAGGTDPEPTGRIRVNTASATAALGHIVSASDYQAFARMQPGIAKAKLNQSINGLQLVVIGDAGAPLLVSDDDDPRWSNLTAALLAASPWARPAMRVAKMLKLRIEVEVTGTAEANDDELEADVRAALIDAFSFERRQLGQPASATDALRAIHSVREVAFGELRGFRIYALEDPAVAAREPIEQKIEAILDPATAPASDLLFLDSAMRGALSVTVRHG
jgi:predicted phage baseplate assembly protein